MIGYWLTRETCPGKLFLGTADDVDGILIAIRNEIEAEDGLPYDERDAMTIRACDISQAEIDAMPEFEGW